MTGRHFKLNGFRRLNSINSNLELAFNSFFELGASSIIAFIKSVKFSVTISHSIHSFSGAPWVRKNGNPSMREILVNAGGMARGCVRLRRRTSPQMTFLHEVIFAQRALAC